MYNHHHFYHHRRAFARHRESHDATRALNEEHSAFLLYHDICCYRYGFQRSRICGWESSVNTLAIIWSGGVLVIVVASVCREWRGTPVESCLLYETSQFFVRNVSVENASTTNAENDFRNPFARTKDPFLAEESEINWYNTCTRQFQHVY